MAATVKEPVSASNPFYGCAILIIAALTFGGIVTWILYSGYKQNQEIATFTVAEAPALPVSALTDAGRKDLEAKLGAFAKDTKEGKPATLTLSLEEMNQLITLAGEKKVVDYDYRGILHFTALDAKAGRLLANIRWKMNNLPFTKAPDRFLVGTATFEPRIENDSFDIYLDSVTVPGKTVSPGFVAQLKTIPWLAVVKTNKDIGEVLKHVRVFRFSEDGTAVVLEATGKKKS